MSSASVSSTPGKGFKPRSHNLNRRRFFWIFVGYYIFAVFIKSSLGKEGHPDIPSLNGHPSSEHGSDPGASDHGSEHSEPHGIQIAHVDFEAVETPFIIGLWIFCASLAKIGFHMTPKLGHIFPESCLLIVVGVVIGLLLFHTGSVHVSPLTPEVFFFYMLPPIILDAGYFMPNRLFFDNLGTILLMAVIGTVWNTFTIGLSLFGVGQWIGFDIELPLLQTLLFSALISAVDPVAVLAVFEEIHVNEVLYIVVFGESLLNDAVTVVLYHMFEDYAKMGPDKVGPIEVLKGCASFPVVALGGTAIGIIWGFLTGFVTRFTNHVRVIEPIFIFVMAYLAFLCAETFHMSGILAVTFCGITMKNYVEANISGKSHTTVKYAMKMLSSSSETIIFMFLGVSTIHDNHEWNSFFIAATIIFCTVYRILGTIMFTYVANKFRLHKLGRVDQFVMSYGGLRGAVAFALVLLIKKDAVNCDERLQKMFITTTIAVVYFTVFVQGITIKPLVQWLKVKKAEKRDPTMNERIHERLMDHMMAAMESLAGQVGHYNLRNKFKQFDNQYIRPCIIRDLKGAEPKILETYSKLTMKDAMERMNKAPNMSGINLSQMSPEAIAQLMQQMNNANAFTEAAATTPNVDDSTWNMDLHELGYNIPRKNISDAKIHHLLSEEFNKPHRRHRRLSYSRHAVNENDLGTEQQVNYRQPMNFKKMMSDKAQRLQKVRRPGVVNNDDIVTNGRVTFGEEYDNPAFSMTDERMQRSSDGRDNDVGIYFIAGGGSMGDYSSRCNNWNDRRWSQSSCSSVKSYMEKDYPHVSHPIHRLLRRPSKMSDVSPEDNLTLAELTLPWRRDVVVHQIMPNNRFRVSPARRMTRDEEGLPPSQTELPWRRDGSEHEGESFVMRQNEFPAWSSNKEYLAYNSPTNTFLGGIGGQPKIPSVMGIFKRDSISSTPGSRRDSLQSQQNRMDSPRHSIGSDGSGGAMGPLGGGRYHESPLSSSPETSSPGGLGSGRRGSAFLPPPIPEDAEEDVADRRGGSPPNSGGGNGNGNNGRDRPVKRRLSSDGPPTSPMSSSKSPLEVIDEGGDPSSSSAQTKL